MKQPVQAIPVVIVTVGTLVLTSIGVYMAMTIALSTPLLSEENARFAIERGLGWGAIGAVVCLGLIYLIRPESEKQMNVAAVIACGWAVIVSTAVFLVDAAIAGV